LEVARKRPCYDCRPYCKKENRNKSDSQTGWDAYLQAKQTMQNFTIAEVAQTTQREITSLQ